jgi:hypothetical protein
VRKEKAALLKGRFFNFLHQVYFGGGVVSPDLVVVAAAELFFSFFPLLGPLALVLAGGVVLCAVALLLPGGRGCGFNELLPSPVCARARLAPRTNVITNVNTFFIQFSVSGFLLLGPWVG